MNRPKDNPESQNYLLRSLFFIPGHIEKYFEKIEQFDCDAVILDIEDSVPIDSKNSARQNIKNILETGRLKNRQVIIRINELDSGMLLDDFNMILHGDVFAIMPSKIYSARDLFFFDEILSQFESKIGLNKGHFRILPLIETLLAFESITEISQATSRLIGLAFGGEDYLKELGGKHGIDDHTFDYPRTKIAIAAKSAGLQAIDTPYLDVKDSEGFIKREEKSRDLGFEGCLLIHPSQIKTANDCFSPSLSEIQRAKKIVESVNLSRENGLSVALIDGVLIGPPMEKNAYKTLQKQNLIETSGIK